MTPDDPAMTPLADLDLPALDPADPALRGPAFRAALEAAAARSWLARAPLGHVVLDREAASFFLRSRAAGFPGRELMELFDVSSGPLHEEMARNILHLDGADHARLRHLVNPAFTPRAADAWRPRMRELLAELWAPLTTRGRCEAVADLADPYPGRVIATVVGAPLADAGRLASWSRWIQKQFDAVALVQEREGIERAVEEFYAWAGELLGRRRRDPRDDLVSRLIAVEEAGDRLSDAELVNLVLNVLVGGVDTTASQLAQALRLFAEAPDEWRALADDPARVAAAVDEVIRWEPITPFTARIVREGVEFRGVEFPPGAILLVCAQTANRDGVAGPDAFAPGADRGREKSLTFGAGIHYCLGANLARAELSEALAFLAPRMPGLALDGEPEWDTPQGIYGLRRLPLRWET